MYFSEVLTAGVPKEINEAGTFMRIIASNDEDVNVIFYMAGREVARVEEVGAGYFESVEFDKVRIVSASGGRVRIVTRMGADVGYDRAVGAVNIGGTVTVRDENGAFSQALVAVNAASTQVAAANPMRRYLLIQNKDAALDVAVTVDGSAATAAGGVRLLPGESLELNGRAPTAAINAISPGGVNANVVVVEG